MKYVRLIADIWWCFVPVVIAIFVFIYFVMPGQVVPSHVCGICGGGAPG